MNYYEWKQLGDHGTSSETIFMVMSGIVHGGPHESNFDFNIPHDPADFGRCYRLLNMFPTWRENLKRVSEVFPKWGPLIDNWDELESLYEEEKPSGKAPKLYARMKELEDDCMAADGWIKVSKGSWKKEDVNYHNEY